MGIGVAARAFPRNEPPPALGRGALSLVKNQPAAWSSTPADRSRNSSTWRSGWSLVTGAVFPEDVVMPPENYLGTRPQAERDAAVIRNLLYENQGTHPDSAMQKDYLARNLPDLISAKI